MSYPKPRPGVNASPEPHDANQRDAIQRRALGLSLRLARMAGDTHDPASLLRRAAEAVRETVMARHVVVYQVLPGRDDAPDMSDSMHRAASRLECMGEASAPDASSPVAHTQRLRAAAWQALRTGQTTTWPARRGRSHAASSQAHDGTHDRLGVFAVPLGDARHTVVAAVTDAAAFDQALAVTQHADVALATVARTANLAVALDQADRRQAQLQAIFSNSSEAILTVDRDFHLIEANPAFTSLIEGEAPTFLGKHCSDVLACSNDRGQLLCYTPGCPLAQTFALPQAAPYHEIYWQTASGKRKEISASFAQVPAPDGARGLIIARDMSPVNAANRMRANFISMVSHELRTPLNTINGFLEIVLEGRVGELNPRQEEFLNFAWTSTRRMVTLVEDILFISRVDTGQFELRLDTVAVPEMIEQSVRGFLATAQTAQVEIRMELADHLPTVFADELRLQQVLGNLINNAIKFTPPEGVITVRAWVEDDELRIAVRDTGDGVPVEEQLRIFERFYRLEPDHQAQPGGYGLGLAIARLIVNQHGGRIWVTNAPEGGAIFTFAIPLSLRPADQETRDH